MGHLRNDKKEKSEPCRIWCRGCVQTRHSSFNSDEGTAAVGDWFILSDIITITTCGSDIIDGWSVKQSNLNASKILKAWNPLSCPSSLFVLHSYTDVCFEKSCSFFSPPDAASRQVPNRGRAEGPQKAHHPFSSRWDQELTLLFFFCFLSCYHSTPHTHTCSDKYRLPAILSVVRQSNGWIGPSFFLILRLLRPTHSRSHKYACCQCVKESLGEA